MLTVLTAWLSRRLKANRPSKGFISSFRSASSTVSAGYAEVMTQLAKMRRTGARSAWKAAPFHHQRLHAVEPPPNPQAGSKSILVEFVSPNSALLEDHTAKTNPA
jgi:hypothetical protein